MIDPRMGVLYALGCAEFRRACYLYSIDPDTGYIVNKLLLKDSDDNFNWECVTPLMNGNGELVYIITPWGKTNGTYESVLIRILETGSSEKQSVDWVGGFFSGSIVLHEDSVIYLGKSYNPYFHYYDITSLKISGDEKPELLWTRANAFTEDDIHSYDMLAKSSDGFLYIKNNSVGSNPLSFYQKFDVTSGKTVATQNPFVYRTMDSKPVISETLDVNRICYTSHTPDDWVTTTTKKKIKDGESNRFLTCLKSDSASLEVIFDIALPPARTGVTHWYSYNPSLSFDEKEIYLVNGYYPISPTPTTSFYVINSENGEIITSSDLDHDCQTHDVPFSVFKKDSNYRFVIACVDEKQDVYLYSMDKKNNLQKLKILEAENISSKQNIQVITDDNDCVYFCWYQTFGSFPDYTDIMKCGRTCF